MLLQKLFRSAVCLNMPQNTIMMNHTAHQIKALLSCGLLILKKVVSIKSYQIRAGGYTSGWISGWTLSVSLDNTSWTIADSPLNQEPEDKIFNLSKPLNARCIKIDGSAALYTGSNKALLAFYHIKFFGSLFVINREKTCFTKRSLNMNLIRMIASLCS